MGKAEFIRRNSRPHGLKLTLFDPRRKRHPPVSITQQNNEIRLDSGLLAPRDLSQTDLDGPLVDPGLFAHAPPQIDGLKPRTLLRAPFHQFRKDLLLKCIPGSAFRSSKVELTKMRNVRVAVGMSRSRWLPACAPV